MSDLAAHLTPAALLQHEGHLRRLARSLLADEHAAEDLVQDTYARALQQPGPIQHARAWLSTITRRLAIDARRTGARRSAREEATARPEALQSTAALVERMTLQHEVVDAVLCLKEPYRSVVLAHHFEGKDAAAIALETGRSTGTVRSQLSRAHAQLREQLDDQIEGGRPTWSALALGAGARGLTRTPVTSGLGWGGWLAAGLVAVSVGGALVVRGRQAPDLSFVPEGGPRASAALATVEPSHDAEPPRSTARSAPQVAPAVIPEAVKDALDETPHQDPPTTPEDRARANRLADLFNEAVQLQRHLRREALSPNPQLVEEQAEFLAQPDTGIVRLRDRNATGPGSRFEQLTGVRGGGCYYSFATGYHSYDAHPDIELQAGNFSSGFYGNTIGLVFDIGDIPLLEVPVGPTCSHSTRVPTPTPVKPAPTLSMQSCSRPQRLPPIRRP